VTTVFPGEIATSLHDHQQGSLPGWYRGGEQADSADELAAQVLRAVERDQRHLHFRRAVKGMRVLDAVAPRIADRVLRRLRGESAAPRRD
jgi:hypothetical protein